MSTKPRKAAAKPTKAAATKKSPRPTSPTKPEQASRKRTADEPIARQLMRRDVVTVDQSTPLSEVERILTENQIGGAPVTDETGALIGVVSLRDLVERYTEDPDARPRRGRGWYQMSSDDEFEAPEEREESEGVEVPEESEETARDVMTAEVYSVPDTAPLHVVAAEMAKHKIHRILVVAGGRHVGLIGTFEVLAAVAR